MHSIRRRGRVLSLLLIVVVLLLIQGSVLAQGPEQSLTVTPLTPATIFHAPKANSPAPPEGSEVASRDKLVSVIVKLEDASLAAYRGGIQGLAPTNPDATGRARLDAATGDSQAYLAYLDKEQRTFEAKALTVIPQAQVIHHYSVVLNGLSMLVPADAIRTLSKLPGVEAVYRDQLMQIDTEASPQFIGAPTLWNKLGGQDMAGEGTIVGDLDSGIWPEHPSFSDPDPAGKAYGPPPVVPGSNGFGSGGPRSTCDFGNTAYNPNDAPFTCNNKLIGAYSFIDTYKAIVGLLPTEFDSARDDNGHGTHTASTAAGNRNVAASIFGIPRGIVSGIAPRAHVIMYRVCGDEGCYGSDSMRAVEQAILDGVDAINFSISGGGSPYSDPVSLAFKDAYDAGVFVSASAGNAGPGADTVDHREPWTTTVGASTTNRHFLSTVTLTADNSDTLTLTGASVTDGISTPTPVVLADDFGDELCLTPFPPGTFSGQIVVCERGIIARVEKSFNVAAGGAGGLLLYNPTLQGLATDNHFIPSVHLENDAGADLLAFMASHTGVTGTFTQGTATAVPGDVMAAFSSRGGPAQSLGISKPDVTAPGVQILAGNTPLPATVEGGLPGQLFQAIQGTSMSAPHVTGSAALIKQLHPNWTPGQIKSALMTSAKTDGVTKEDGTTPADPFDFGSGRIDLSKAGTGLTIDETTANYEALEDELWNANYPSLYVPIMPGQITVQRTVHSVLPVSTRWRTKVEAPADVKITVPSQISVAAGRDATFSISVDARNVPVGEVRHATLHLLGGRGVSPDSAVHIPITIVRQQPAVTLDKVCDPADIPLGGVTDCTITVENTSFDDATVTVTDQLPRELWLLSGSLTGGASQVGNGLRFEGSLFAAAPPDPTVSAGASPFGYLPLSGFGIPPEGGVGDETIVNFTGVPPFVFAGETWNSIGMVSNGYAVVGGGTGADIDFINQNLPDPTPPNNVLASFWTDLNPATGTPGSGLRAGILSAGPLSWLVLDWEDVPNWGDGLLNDFQIWIGLNGVEDISYVYGPDLTAGDSGFLTVGVENKFGNSGQNFYVDGVGTLPPPNFDGVVVTSVPGAPGETHEITFSARLVSRRNDEWTNCAQMTGDVFFGTSIACFTGGIQ